MNKKTAQGLPDFLEEIGSGIIYQYDMYIYIYIHEYMSINKYIYIYISSKEV